MQKRMSVIIDAFTKGGAQRVLLTLVPLWQEQGFSVQLVLLQSSDSELPLESLFNSNVAIVRVDAKRLHDISGFVRFYREISTFKPEIVQCHLYWSQLWGSLYKVINRNVTIVWVEHNMYIHRSFSQWYLFKLLSRKADEIVAVSKEVEHYLAGRDLRNIRFVPNPISRKFFSHFQEERRNVFVFVGRLNLQKNPLLALSAFRLAISENLIPSDSRLVYAGEGNLESKIRSEIVKYGLEERVALLGFLPELELAHILNTSKCLVSTSSHEGMPLARIEALATGCTIVTTRTGGISGVLTQTPENDFLIPGVFVVLPTPLDLANAFSKAVSEEFWSNEEIESRVERARNFDPFIIAKKYLQ